MSGCPTAQSGLKIIIIVGNLLFLRAFCLAPVVQRMDGTIHWMTQLSLKALTVFSRV